MQLTSLKIAPNFYRAALNAGQSNEEKAVRLSVKRMYCDKTQKNLSTNH